MLRSRRLCEPCRTGVGAQTHDGKPITARELCASRLTKCSNHRALVNLHVRIIGQQIRRGT